MCCVKMLFEDHYVSFLRVQEFIKGMNSVSSLVDGTLASGVYCLEARDTAPDLGTMLQVNSIMHFVIDGRQINDMTSLFDAFFSELNFPFFGSNWDALLDCLRDLSWIEGDRLVVEMSRMGKFATQESRAFETLLMILKETAAFAQEKWLSTKRLYFIFTDDTITLPENILPLQVT